MRNYFAIFRKIIIFASWYSAICWICSHTLRGCVDWNTAEAKKAAKLMVTPFVGVWIETRRNVSKSFWQVCHTLRGCVDWNKSIRTARNTITSHTLRGCVDWNDTLMRRWERLWCHTLRGCVDWNYKKIERGDELYVTPFVGVWIETASMVRAMWQVASHPSWVCGLKHQSTHEDGIPRFVTPFVGVWIETPLL